MAGNLVTNPSFESGGTGWTLGHALVTDAYGGRTGDYACYVYAWRQFVGDPLQSGEAYQDVTVEPGDILVVSVYARLARGNVTAILAASNPTASKQRNIDEQVVGDEWTKLSGSFVARGSSITVNLRLGNIQSAASGDAVLFDDVEVIVVPITKTIRDAIVSDLQDISTANGYETDLVEVGTEPKRREEVRVPAVYLVPEQGGVAELETLSNGQGEAIQRIAVDCLVRSSTPHDDAIKLLDDVRNAVERSDGATLAVNGVESVQVVEWSEVMTSEDVGDQWGIITATIEVAYVYSRGSA